MSKIITIISDELANFPENGREDVIYLDENGIFYEWNGISYNVVIAGNSGLMAISDYSNNFLLMGG